MRTPLEALTEVRKRLEARRTTFQECVRKSTEANLRRSAEDYATQAFCMSEVLNIITDVEQGH